MLFGTTIVPLVLQNATHFVQTNPVESVCQSSTVVLSVSTTAITATDGSVSTSYSIFPVNKYISQATGLPTTTRQSNAQLTGSSSVTQNSDVATSYLSLSVSFSSRSGDQSPSFVGNIGAPPATTSSSHLAGISNLPTALWSTSLSFIGSILPSLVEPSSPTEVPGDSIIVSQQSTSTIPEQAVAATASSTSLSTASINPVYTCPRDNGMYYSDTAKRVYQLLCSIDEPESNLGTTYQPQLQSCVDSCGNLTGCLGVSYTSTSGSCSYKSSVFISVESSTSDSAILADYICPGADGTRLVDSSGSVYEILCNTYFPASSNISSSLVTSDLASCSEICSNTDSCSGFTFQNSSCTLVSNRNSNDGVLQMNVATAILIAKRVAQDVSRGIAPYRSTSLVRSLPVDASRTPSSTIQPQSTTSATSNVIAQISLGTSTVGTSRIIISSSFSTVSGISLTTQSTTIVLPHTISAGNLESTAAVPSSQDLPVSSPLSSREQAAAITSTTLGTSVTISATASTSNTSINSASASSTSISGTFVSSAFISSTFIDYSVRSSIRSLPTEIVSTTINRSSRTLTAPLNPTLPSVTQTSSLPVTSHASSLTNTELLSSLLSSGTSNGGRETLHSITSGRASLTRVTLSIDAALSSADNVAISTIDTTSSQVLRTVSYSPAPSGSSPQTSYSCPAVDGDMVQANTGGYYTIGCDDETTGYDVIIASAPDFNDCMTYCDQTSGCTAWTYVGSCYLKTGTSPSDFSFRPSTRGAISGIRNVPTSSSSPPGTSTRASATGPPTFVSQTASSTRPSNEDPIPTSVESVSSSSLPITEELSTSVVSAFASVQTFEDSTTRRSITTTPLPSGLNIVSGLATQDTISVTSVVSSRDTASTITNSEAATTLSRTTQNTFSISLGSASSVTDSITLTSVNNAVSVLTTTDIVSTTITAASQSVSCSIFDNLLDVCLDAAITPSVGAGGGINVGFGSNTITIIGASTGLAITPSVAASIDLGISVGTDGVGVGASASVGLNPGVATSRSATITSMPSASCSAGGNVLNICIDAAITPSIGIGGNAGVGVGVGSNTITLVDISASLAVAPSLTASLDLGLSIGSSGIGLIASATIGAGLGLDSSGAITVGPLLPNITASASAGVGLNLNLGPSSSALTVLDATVVVAPSAAAGLDLGLSVGSSGLGLAPSATLGLDLSLSIGLGGQPRPSSTSSKPSTSSSINSALLPTSSIALLPGLGPTTVSSRPSSASSKTTTSSSTSTSTRATTTTAGLVQNLASALGRQVTSAHNWPNRRQGFTTIVRVGHL